MFSNFKSAAFAALIALGAVAGLSGTANANGFYVGIGTGNVQIGYNGGHHGPSWSHPSYRPAPRHACSARAAVNKADRMGLRRAHVVREDRRKIHVEGRRGQRRSTIVFARTPNCPVINRY